MPQQPPTAPAVAPTIFHRRGARGGSLPERRLLTMYRTSQDPPDPTARALSRSLWLSAQTLEALNAAHDMRALGFSQADIRDEQARIRERHQP